MLPLQQHTQLGKNIHHCSKPTGVVHCYANPTALMNNNQCSSTQPKNQISTSSRPALTPNQSALHHHTQENQLVLPTQTTGQNQSPLLQTSCSCPLLHPPSPADVAPSQLNTPTQLHCFTQPALQMLSPLTWLSTQPQAKPGMSQPALHQHTQENQLVLPTQTTGQNHPPMQQTNWPTVVVHCFTQPALQMLSPLTWLRAPKHPPAPDQHSTPSQTRHEPTSPASTHPREPTGVANANN